MPKPGRRAPAGLLVSKIGDVISAKPSDVDAPGAVVVVGDEADLSRTKLIANDVTWTDEPYEGRVRVQCSAHGATTGATIETGAAPSQVCVVWDDPQRRVAPGQSVVFYDESDRRVLGGGTAAP